MSKKKKAEIDVAITPSTRVEETLEERAKKINTEFQQLVNECLTEAGKGAVEFGLAPTEVEAYPLITEFMSNCGKRMVDFLPITQVYIEKHAQLFFARWVFTNYKAWRFLVDDLIGNETEAILSGLQTFLLEGDPLPAYGENTTVDGIIDKWETKIKPLQAQLRMRERALKRMEAALVDTKRQEAGFFAVCCDNEIIARLFPSNGKKGIVPISVKGKEVGKCYLKYGLSPIDMAIFASLVSSITKNTAKNKYGEEFYYISQGAFCRAFFGLEKEKRAVKTAESRIIEDAVDRLANARFMNISIAVEDTSLKLAYEYGEQTDQEPSEAYQEPSEAYITSHPRYLPIFEYERDLPNLVNGAAAWVIKKADLESCPIVELAREIKRFYNPHIRLIPSGVRKTESLTNAVYSILNDYILKWGEKSKAEILLDEYTPIREEGSESSRQAISKQRAVLKSAIIETLRHWEKEGFCAFLVGRKIKGGGLRFKGALSTAEDLGKIKALRLAKVNRDSWSKVDLKSKVAPDPEEEKEIVE